MKKQMKKSSRSDLALWIVWFSLVGISIGIIIHMMFVSTTIIGG